MTRRSLALLALLAALLLTACGSESEGPVTLTMYVDSRIEAAATELVEAFEPDNPGIRLELVTGTSDELADRIRGGERADIMIGLRRELDQLRAEEVVQGDVLLLGSDVFGIVVPEGNPANVLGLDAFTPGGPVRTAICTQGTCHRNAAIALRTAAIPVDQVTQLELIPMLFQVAGRDLDASMAWTSQAAAVSSKLELVRLPGDLERREDFTIGAVEDTPTVERTVSWLATDEASIEVLEGRGLRPRSAGAEP